MTYKVCSFRQPQLRRMKRRKCLTSTARSRYLLEALALLAAPSNPMQATQLWLAATDLRKQLGVHLSIHDPLYEQASCLGLMAQLTATSGSETYALALQQAVAAALDSA